MSAPDQAQRVLGCVEFASLFHHPLVEDTPPPRASVDERRRYRTLINKAYDVCAACPLIDDCLYRAVVEVDVAGYAGATTPRQRALIRARLQVSVEPEDFDTTAGVTGRHRQVDHDEVVRLRSANPHESLETLAQRLGCSLSTVKRHLRRERNSPTARRPRRALPSRELVRAVAAEVTGRLVRQAQAA
jgi:Transcription factor WhiB